MNRDVNACKNIMKLGLHWLYNQTRPDEYKHKPITKKSDEDISTTSTSSHKRPRVEAPNDSNKREKKKVAVSTGNKKRPLGENILVNNKKKRK